MTRRFLLALLVSGGLLTYLFLANEVDPRALGPILRAVSLPGILLFVAVSLVALLLRALRYWLLLERRAGLWPLTLVTLVRNLFVDLVPMRAGAAASYLYLVTARLGLPLEAALASFTLSFVLDALAIAPLLLLAVLLVGTGPVPAGALVGGSVLVLAAAVAMLAGLAPMLRAAARIVVRLPRLSRLEAWLAGAAGEVRRLEARQVLAPALALSLGLRVAKYGAYYCLLQALLVNQGHPWGSLDFLRVFLSVAGAELAASLPLPTIASLGPYETAGALGFEHWLGLDRALATLAATAFHALSQVHDYGLGLLALLWIMAPWPVRWIAPTRRAVSLTRRGVFLGVLVVLGLAVSAGIALPRIADELPDPLDELARWPERLWARFVPPRLAASTRLADLTPAEREAVAGLGARLDGVLVWSSNRSGDHELYVLDLRARSVRRLTRHPHVDFASRISPDGRRVVFLRSQREWVSFREQEAWDVHLVNLDGSGERRLVRGGYHPTWTADGRAIVFHRGGRVFRYDLAEGRESLLFDGPRAVRGLEKPGEFELSPEGGRLTFAFREPWSGAAVFDLGAGVLTALTRVQACQTSWGPDGQSVVWVEAGGQGGTRVMTGRPDGREHRVLMDLPGPRSHEYFPRLSPDGRWLVWGASARGHEHDRADYELFLWEVGAPWEQAVRLTHHPGNDQWPDLWVRGRSGA